MTWHEDDIGTQDGRVALVTGANSGIGWHTARALAVRGAHVVLACRNRQRAETAAAEIVAIDGNASVSVLDLDLSDLTSVEAAAKEFQAEHSQLDLLINNAGLVTQKRSETALGHEMMFGVNHLGHFALTARLLPLVMSTEGSRVVNVASNAHKFGKMDFDDLHYSKGRKFSSWRAYGQSKLANLLFTLELQQRLEAAVPSPNAAGTITAASHPGWARTNIANETEPSSAIGAVVARAVGVLRPAVEKVAAHDSNAGAQPTLLAAIAPEVTGAGYYGPSKGNTGVPVAIEAKAHATDRNDAAMLWAESERLTGVSFEI